MLQLHGMLRVIMKPLITTVPIVGGLQVFFLNNPSLDFNLVGIADILDMPGLRYKTCYNTALRYKLNSSFHYQ